jgi:hypothetical protein
MCGCNHTIVANTECFSLDTAIRQCFELQSMHTPSRNLIVVRVAIDVHSELQIPSASAWYYTTPSFATRQWFELQLIYTPSCKYWVLPPDTILVLQLQPNSELQLIYTSSCKYWVLPPDTILPIQLQPNSGSSRNWYTLRVANTKRFWTVVRVAIDVHSELQILSAFSLDIATGQWFELQSMHTLSCNRPLSVHLQPASGSSCNQYTLWVANTEFSGFHLRSGLDYIFFTYNDIVTSLLSML